MKRSIFKKQTFIQLLLLILAIAVGGSSSMAMAMTDLPNDNPDATQDHLNLYTQLGGYPASATQLDAQGILLPQTEREIVNFKPFLWTMSTMMMYLTPKKNAQSYVVKAYRSGNESLDFILSGAITNSTAKAVSVTLPVSAAHAKRIQKYQTLLLPTINGYADDCLTPEVGLVLFVRNKTDDGVITVEATNGQLNDDGEIYVPDIPAGTRGEVMNNACSESQLVVPAENYAPVPYNIFLQRSIVNIVLTGEFSKSLKEIPFGREDVYNDALYKFRRRQARTLWYGRKYKTQMPGTDGKQEDVYFSEGVLRQIDRKFTIGDEITFANLVGISKMQFTQNAQSTHATAFCGKNFIEKLLNIDFTRHKEISFTGRTVLGIDISSFKSTFGTIDFVHDQTLDDLGFPGICAVIDLQNALYYRKEEEKRQTDDMSQGAGDVRDAERDITITTSAITLRGFNSVLVGASSDILFAGLGTANASNAKEVTISATLPATPNEGDVVYLTTATTTPVFAANTLVQYDGSAWTSIFTEGQIIYFGEAVGSYADNSLLIYKGGDWVDYTGEV